MSDMKQMFFVMDFAKRARVRPIESTGAAAVTFAGDLYNVIGSTNDPKKVPGHLNEAWKQLLISVGGVSADSKCYVTNPNPEGTHPAFSYGGHMTVNSDGSVNADGKCYLMPICAWHNGKANEGVKFTHTETQMVQLSGYMQGELAVTFQLRLPSPKPYAALYFTEGRWRNQNLSEGQVKSLRHELFGAHGVGEEGGYYFLFKRDPKTHSLHYVDEVSLLK